MAPQTAVDTRQRTLTTDADTDLVRPRPLVEGTFPPIRTRQWKRRPAPKPTLFELGSAIVRETKCTQEQGEALVAMIDGALKRVNANGIARLTNDDMRHHRLLDRVMKDEAKAKKGSAHELLNRAFGVTLRHTQTEDHSSVAIGVS